VVNPTFFFYGEKMNIKNKTKIKNTSIVLLLSLTLLMGGNLQSVSAQSLDRISNYSVHLAITPSNVEEGSQSHPIGYVYILNKNGVPISSDVGVEVMLTSDNPSVASVPETIIFSANAEYAKFDVTTGINGKTTITATLSDQTGFTDILVGSDESQLPDDLVLELNLPTDKMHVNSVMPFSVFLRTSDGTVVRAPYDMDVMIDFEKSLAVPNNDTLTIKAGEYYAWGTISTGEKVGNAFLRAIQSETQLDTAKSIEITSTLPAALSINIYPYLIPAEIDRNLDIFVSVVDSNGDPTLADEDIPLKFFSNNQDFIGEELDDAMDELNMVIKQGEFGYHFRLNVDLIGLVSNDLLIGVSSAGLGTAIDKFQTVGESISVEDKRISDNSLLSSDRKIEPTDRKAVQIFGPLRVPSNATAIFAYQLTIEEDDDDDSDNLEDFELELPNDEFVEVDLNDVIELQQEHEEDRREGMNTQDRGGAGDIETESDSTSSGSSVEREDYEDVLIYNIDFIVEGNLYPIQANEDYRSTGLIQYLDVLSEDDTLATVIDPGNIRPSYSYGVAKIETTQKSGEVLISANVKGIGSGSFLTEVVNTLEQKEIIPFSPTGNDSILINRDGSFDIFLVALDGSDRPKVLEKDKRFLITPTNGIVDVKRNTAFSMTTLQSESFKLTDGGSVVIKVESIGQGADVALESSNVFKTQLSSKINVLFPLDHIDVNKKNNVGVIQLVDLQGNPIKSFKELRAKITSSDESVILSPEDAIIKKGESYVEFPITVTEKIGSSTISSSARGVVGSGSLIETSTSSSSLSVFTSGLIEPIPVNEEIQVKIFVDDDFADSVAGATVRITPDANVTTTTDVVRTGSDGSAVFGLEAINGPEVSVTFDITAQGYKDGHKVLDIIVDTPASGVQAVNLPTELVYVIIGGIAVVIIVVVLFLKKSKEPLDDEEEPWEDEDI
jgi:hypothetical protein